MSGWLILQPRTVTEIQVLHVFLFCCPPLVGNDISLNYSAQASCGPATISGKEKQTSVFFMLEFQDFRIRLPWSFGLILG